MTATCHTVTLAAYSWPQSLDHEMGKTRSIQTHGSSADQQRIVYYIKANSTTTRANATNHAYSKPQTHAQVRQILLRRA